MIDVKALDDTALATLLDECRAEYQRRRSLTDTFKVEPDLADVYLIQQGRGEGEPWKQPLGEFDAYPKHWVVECGGSLWVSLVDHNTWRPGTSGWRIVNDDDTPAPWVRPTGAHDVYKIGDRVAHGGRVWTCLVDGNVWEPGAMGSETAWAEDPDD